MRWSETADDYYPVNPRPRWGFTKPVHPGIKPVLERSRAGYEAVLDVLDSHRDALHAVSYTRPKQETLPFWNNIWFSSLDAASLIGFLLSRRPARYIEIGSGNSTLFAKHAINWGNLSTTLTSIDPNPRASIDALCDRVVRQPLEECDLEIFQELRPGDILFLDGTHRAFTNSDVVTFFFDVLPTLCPGVLIHLHDIFLPADYPPQWNRRLYSEQYILGAMLLCPATPFRVVLPNYFVCNDEPLTARVLEIFHSDQGQDIPFLYNNGPKTPSVSFWFETI